jgi:hypothetical protein
MTHEIDAPTAATLLSTFADKYNYFEKVKMDNFKESMRLEGYDIQIDHIPADSAAIDVLKAQLIKKYSQYSQISDDR